jgi:hypothetical protein
VVVVLDVVAAADVVEAVVLVGAGVAAGAVAEVTIAVAAEVATDVPFLFDAKIVARSVDPTSAAARAYA